MKTVRKNSGTLFISATVLLAGSILFLAALAQDKKPEEKKDTSAPVQKIEQEKLDMMVPAVDKKGVREQLLQLQRMDFAISANKREIEKAENLMADFKDILNGLGKKDLEFEQAIADLRERVKELETKLGQSQKK